ncbi:L-serine ammonia-lyase, iron-sulfur-dependent subunit beta [Paenibacillus dendritiformis]|uniref:L-serine deaminase n=1 Tax=Paenibacillus dendritiformis C454 TaxID=1131935 RepID=H3SKA4_9BACL|nr:L-serine ammonia-lyase, iron-sulfur-dependent subunit beta [Paenibacillus dendritiformis]EHQ60496.1 L-serine dehydratase, iron-sulfur-dependent subunit beta [Paenibacillus dendritiformis C454]PZM63378.1 L-serine ammonia-lyase, iron-sulfur-dependent, subunit beta [Paenibacillus dendritiformis]WGU93666.1 L-serine ammonia-lyase, iron-sulfur-dependent subunit beta [Paenibacillus dendritiformis]CAH8767487.1 L-serine ammonia-lyase, iron-sulfur-dependent subunit beta [Paenibacillus dendritiformis]
MKYRSVFDIIGPIMVGPSSSHTAGAAKIGRLARSIFGRQPKKVHIFLYGSFAETYKGHATDVALVAGLLDFDTNDARLPQSLQLAEEAGMTVEITAEDAVPEHPNTARIRLSDDQEDMEVTGISIGGGKVEIVELNGFKLKLSGQCPAILILNHDRYGVIAGVTRILSEARVNIGHMEVSRKEKGKMALMVIETDEMIDEAMFGQIRGLPGVNRVLRMED